MVVSFVRIFEDIHKTLSQTPYQAFFGSLREREKEAGNRKRQFAYSDFAPMHTQAK